MKGLENDPFLLGLGPAYMTHLPSLSIKIPDFVLLRGWSRFLFKIHGRSSWPPHFIAWFSTFFCDDPTHTPYTNWSILSILYIRYLGAL